VVHVHLFPAQYYVVFANLLNGNKSKLIFTEHSTSNTRMNSFFLKGIDRLTYKGYKKVVAISNDVELIFNKYLNNAKKQIVTIENGVNLSKIHNSVALKKTQLVYSLTEENKLIVQVGGFRIEKDQDTIIKALQFLPNTFHLLFVGEGERKADLEALVNKMGVQDRVHFLGVRKDVFTILKCVDYVVVSSHWEGFGLAAVEGMAASKPVVASNVNGLKEVVGGAGVLFEKENSKQFADIIIKLDTDLAYYNAIAEACKQKAEQFDIAIMVEKHINLYKTVYES
jgi:glycosyltransferase involved in cell wall biosynthesis